MTTRNTPADGAEACRRPAASMTRVIPNRGTARAAVGGGGGPALTRRVNSNGDSIAWNLPETSWLNSKSGMGSRALNLYPSRVTVDLQTKPAGS